MPTLFGGLVPQDPALGAQVHLRLPENLRRQLGPVINEATKTALAEVKDPNERAEQERLMRLLEPTLAAGELDAAAVLLGERQGTATVAGGVKVANGKDLDQFVRGEVSRLAEKDRDLWELDAVAAGAVKGHRWKAQGLYTEEMRAVLGEQPMYLGFGPTGNRPW
jgi:hypothetical protein